MPALVKPGDLFDSAGMFSRVDVSEEFADQLKHKSQNRIRPDPDLKNVNLIPI